MIHVFRYKVFVVVLLACITFAVQSVSAETINGRLVSVYNDHTGEATTFIAGYCQGSPVVIGPKTKQLFRNVFSTCTEKNMDSILIGEGFIIKRVTKFSNNGKEIVAEVILDI